MSALQQELQPGPRTHLPRGRALGRSAVLLLHLQEEPEWSEAFPQTHEETRDAKVTAATSRDEGSGDDLRGLTVSVSKTRLLTFLNLKAVSLTVAVPLGHLTMVHSH